MSFYLVGGLMKKSSVLFIGKFKMIDKPVERLFEDGFAEIMLGAFLLRKQGKYQEAYDELGVVLDLIMQDRQELRIMYKVKP